MLDTKTLVKPAGTTVSATASTQSAPPPTVPIPTGFNANCTITNKSGVDVMVLDGTASSDTAIQILFEQDLKILTDTTGSSILKAGAQSTYLLNDNSYDTDSSTWIYDYAYNLIFVRADNLFPVKVAGVLANFATKGYDNILISLSDLTAMQDSEKFQQSIQAYPDSLLAQGFAQACNDAMNNANSDTDIDDSVNAYFASTVNYKNVTLNSLTAIQTYWETYPFVWAGYGATKTYYLYTATSDSEKSVGSLTITAPATVPASIDKSLPGFTIGYTAAGARKPTPLKYMNGMFVDNPEMTNIALKGIYQLKSSLTNVATDNVITAYLSGTVLADTVLGFDEQLTQDSSGNWSGFYDMLHPKDAAGWMTLILEVGAVVMTIEVFGKPLKALWDKYREYKAKNKGENPPKDKADALRSEAKAGQAQDVSAVQGIMDKMSPGTKIEITLDVKGAITKLQIDRSDRVTEDSRSNQIDINKRQAESVDTVAKYEMNPTVETIANKVETNAAILDPANTNTEALKGQLDGVKATAASVEASLSVEAVKVETKASATENQEMANAAEANKEAQERQEQMDQNKDTSKDGDGGSDTFVDGGGSGGGGGAE